MVSSDTVVGIVGAVILTGAMIAVFYYENNAAQDGGEIVGEGGNVYTFNYETQQESPVQGQIVSISAVGNSQDVTFDLPAYVYNVHAEVTWTDTGDSAATTPLASGQDTAKVELLNEADVVLDDNTTATGENVVHHGHGPTGDTNTTPPQQTVQVRGDDPDSARQNLKEASEEDGHGVGTWTVRITLENTANAQAAAPTDTSNEFTVTVTYSYWAPVLQE